MRRTPVLETPDKMFTVYMEPNPRRTKYRGYPGHNKLIAYNFKDDDIEVGFLFYNRHFLFREDLEQEVQKIVNDPEFKRLIGDNNVFIVQNTGETLQITTNGLQNIFPRLECPDENISGCWLYSNLPYKENLMSLPVNFQNVYYKCLKPHKLILGCSECATTDATDKDCILKRHEQYGTASVLEDDPHDVLVNRKTVIADYTYISPKLTSDNHFWPYFREIDYHDFRAVHMMSAAASRSVYERNRQCRFTKEACENCFLYRISCNGNKRCYGNYPKSEKEATEEILDGVKLSFTDKQIAELLWRSGEIEKRSHGRIYAATFKPNGYITNKGALDKIVFGFRTKYARGRYYSLEELSIQKYKYANEWLNSLGVPEAPANLPKLSRETKAVFLELITHNYLPKVSKYQHRQDAIWYIQPVFEGTESGLRFRSQITHGWYGSRTYASKTFRSLNDVYAAYNALNLLKQKESPHRHRY